MRKLSLALTCVLFLSSCVSKINVKKHYGDSARITFSSGEKLDVELLAVTDSNLVVVYRDWIRSVDFSGIKTLYVHGYAVRPEWKLTAAILSVLIDGIVTGELIGSGEYIWGGLYMVATGGTIYGFATSGPKVNFRFPLEDDDLETLKLYCRYPQGLTDEQWKVLLQHFDQEDFVPLLE